MDDLTKRVARLVAEYVEHVWPHAERMGGTPDEPMQTAKGSTNPPFGDYAHRIIASNLIASKYISWALETVYNGSVRSSEGIYFSEILRDLRYDAGLVQTWRDRDPVRLRAFREACRFIAKGVLFVYGRTKKERDELTGRLDLAPNDAGAFVVRRYPRDEQLTNGDWQTAHNRDNNEKRTNDAHAAYERIYPKWKKFAEGYPDATQKAKKGMFCAWYAKEEKAEISPRKLERAIEWCEKGVFDDTLKVGGRERRRREGAA